MHQRAKLAYHQAAANTLLSTAHPGTAQRWRQRLQQLLLLVVVCECWQRASPQLPGHGAAWQAPGVSLASCWPAGSVRGGQVCVGSSGPGWWWGMQVGLCQLTLMVNNYSKPL